MKNSNLCAVVECKTMKQTVRTIAKLKNVTQYIEVRTDYLNKQSDIDLAMLKNDTSQKIIITCRRKDEGGKWQASEIDRIGILKQALDLGFLVDVELRTLEEGIFKLNSNMSKQTIISFHDFTKTPSFHELNKVLVQMERYSPKIKKIATMVVRERDIKTLLQLLINKEAKEKLTIIGMGELGREVRIVAPLLEAEMTYCSIDSEGQTAPGQLSCKKMYEIYKLLN